DGHRYEPDDPEHVRHRLGAGGGRGHPVRPRPDHDHAGDGRAHWAQGLRGRRARRHRQHPGRGAGRLLDRPRRAAHGRIRLARLPRRDHVRDPDRDLVAQARGAPRRRPTGEGMRSPRWALRLVVAAAAFAGLFGLELVLEAFVIEYVQRIVLLAGINVILAVALNLINGTTGQFSIGHAGFMAVGAYGAAFFGTQLRPIVEGALGAGALGQAVTFNLALVIGALLAAGAGLVVGVPSLRLRGDYLAVVTLGFGEIIRILFNNAEFLGAATGYFGDDPAGLPAYTTFFWVYAWALATVVAVANLTFSQTGRSLIAIREDEIAAEAMATPTTRLKVLAFTLSAGAAGIGGGLFAHMQAGI